MNVAFKHESGMPHYGDYEGGNEYIKSQGQKVMMCLLSSFRHQDAAKGCLKQMDAIIADVKIGSSRTQTGTAERREKPAAPL